MPVQVGRVNLLIQAALWIVGGVDGGAGAGKIWELSAGNRFQRSRSETRGDFIGSLERQCRQLRKSAMFFFKQAPGRRKSILAGSSWVALLQANSSVVN